MINILTASIPFTSVSVETLENLVQQFRAPERDEMVGETKLFPTLYVGEHEHGLFAVPSLVDEETLMISPAKNGPLLLEGPRNVHVPSEVGKLTFIPSIPWNFYGDYRIFIVLQIFRI